MTPPMTAPENEQPGDHNRWTKESATPGEDPREIDREQQDPEVVERLQRTRRMVVPRPRTGSAERIRAPKDREDSMGTSSWLRDDTVHEDRRRSTGD